MDCRYSTHTNVTYDQITLSRPTRIIKAIYPQLAHSHLVARLENADDHIADQGVPAVHHPRAWRPKLSHGKLHHVRV